VLVDRDEALDGLGDPVDLLPAEPRKRHNAVGRHRAAREGQELPLAQRDRRDASHEVDARLVEQPPDGLARRVAEELERLHLGRDEAHLDAVAAHGGQVRGRHERELVGRQRPARAPGHGERHPSDLSPLDLVEEVAHGDAVGRAAERQRAGDRRLGHGAAGEQQSVVAEDGVARRPGLATVGVHARQGSESDERADGVRQLAEVEVTHLAEVERLCDRDRPVPEARLGREQLDADPPFAELTESESRFERRDTATGDDHREGARFHASDRASGRDGRHRGNGVLAAGFLRIGPPARAAPARRDGGRRPIGHPGAQRGGSERAAAQLSAALRSRAPAPRSRDPVVISEP
jgi:hypothetical protein